MYPRIRRLLWMSLIVVAMAAAGIALTGGSKSAPTSRKPVRPRMSGQGELANRVREALKSGRMAAVKEAASPKIGGCYGPGCEGEGEGGEREDPADTQSETSVAVDSTGTHVVVGFNDFRGFDSDPISVSGFMYSDDGGATFTDGGQLPSPGDEDLFGFHLPWIFGDPDVKYVGACTFIYSSIMLKKFSSSDAVQTMSIHRSTDCGHTWDGPFEVTAATNPNGGTTNGGETPLDAADKEFIDIDKETGRVIMGWANFTPFAAGFVEIATAYSDDILATPPTWSSRVIVANTVADGQQTIPRFGPDNTAYIAWTRYPSYYGRVATFASSADNGATWSAPMEVGGVSFEDDAILGNDRNHSQPGLAVDNSNGPNRGNIYGVFDNDNLADGGDIYFARSTDGGATFSDPIILNARPGDDRAQWFPWITVDNKNGRVFVSYYDQRHATSGDETILSYTYSDDGGLTWNHPLSVTDRPFHAGHGNDTGQPNLGDYNQVTIVKGRPYIVWGGTTPPPLGFADGQPNVGMTVPDVFFRNMSIPAESNRVTLDVKSVTASELNESPYLDPGDRGRMLVELHNYVTNPLNSSAIDPFTAQITSLTPGVTTATRRIVNYPALAPGESAFGDKPFRFTIAGTFVPGMPIIFRLKTINNGKAGAVLYIKLSNTGTPEETTILTEDFESVAPGSLPAGWSSIHGAGNNDVPWTTTNTFCGPTNAAFHPNANDGLSGDPSRWERLSSPLITVPADTEYVTLDMDVCYNTEEDPLYQRLAYDGFFLRVTDFTAGRTSRSVLVEAFADQFTTDNFKHYPRHFPWGTGLANYFEDMSAWAGNSGGAVHTRMRLPGMAGSDVRLRFEYTQDTFSTCQDVRPGTNCGVWVDNIVMKGVKSAQ